MIYILVPVYNEKENLEFLFSSTSDVLRENAMEEFGFIFVNDGSTDGSLELLEQFASENPNVTILSHSPNAGVKRTFLDGFAEFLKIGHDGDILVTKEADNTSDNAVLIRMIEAVKPGGADVALASCYAEGGGVEITTFYRKFLSACANTLVKTRFRLWGLHTFSSFYRSFSYRCLADAFEKYNEDIMTVEGFSCVVEMLVKLHRSGAEIVEIPMFLRCSARKGESKMPVIKTILGYFRLCIKL